jgi:hypothetical protein
MPDSLIDIERDFKPARIASIHPDVVFHPVSSDTMFLLVT